MLFLLFIVLHCFYIPLYSMDEDAFDLKAVEKSQYGIQSFDFEEEEKKLQEQLEKFPITYRQNVIDSIGAQLRPLQICKGPIQITGNFTFENNIGVWNYNDTIYIRDFSQQDWQESSFEHTNIRRIFRAPKAPLFAVSSSDNVTIYSLIQPFTSIKKIPLAGVTGMAFSWQSENPTLYIADTNGHLSILTNFIDAESDYELTQNTFPDGQEMEYMQVAPNDQYLVATAMDNNKEISYMVSLLDGKLTYKALEGTIYNPRIAEDSSFFAATINYSIPEASYIFKDNKKPVEISGIITAIKNNYIFTYRPRDKCSAIYDSDGNFCQEFPDIQKLSHGYLNNSLACVLDGRVYIPESLTIRKLILLMAHEKAFLERKLPQLQLSLHNLLETSPYSDQEVIKNILASINNSCADIFHKSIRENNLKGFYWLANFKKLKPDMADVISRKIREFETPIKDAFQRTKKKQETKKGYVFVRGTAPLPFKSINN